MNFLDPYYHDNDAVRISRQQASDFAKQVAGDFNPIHDTDSKRFCVPGDLLFALTLHKYGLSQRMSFVFKGMVGDDAALDFSPSEAAQLSITDAQGKEYLHIERSGSTTTDPATIEALTRRYVEFSGRTFPQLLVPLMAERRVMLNPERPMVIYESMAIEMQALELREPQLELAEARLEVEGKRGHCSLEFHILDAGEVVGKGRKSLLLSGLRDYEQSAIQQLVDNYNRNKQAYSA